MTLTIEAGTIIKGEPGEGSLASALLIARGGKLHALGTAEAPIIMTSVEDNIRIGQLSGSNLDETQNSLWGGLIILGYAPISVDAGMESQIDGIPPSETFGAYGGNDPADNSGTIQYVSVRFGGASIGEGNEINGITFGGVGNGTIVDHIEVVGNKDDGIECFGGTVNINHALVWGQGDDAFDLDQSYSGTIDNFIYIAGEESDHGLEIDGPEGELLATSNNFTMVNGTFKGLASEYADFRDGARGTIMNSYFFNFPGNADVELDDDATSANYAAGELVISGNEINVSHLSSGNTTLESIFADKAEAGDDAAFDAAIAASNSIVTSPTVGATVSEFLGWSLADVKGELSDF
jgi:hypothetical protein